VPIEDPYRLVALIRSRWRGLTGGQEVWEGIEGFFAELAEGARTVANDRQEDAA
jgi:2-methylcitrate dehydratase PrpD